MASRVRSDLGKPPSRGGGSARRARGPPPPTRPTPAPSPQDDTPALGIQPHRDVAWRTGGRPGGEFADMSTEAIMDATRDPLAQLAVEKMANPGRYSLQVRNGRGHRPSTVLHRMRQPHGVMLVDSLQSEAGVPFPGKGGDPNIRQRPVDLRPGTRSAGSDDDEFLADDSVTQQQQQRHARGGQRMGVPRPRALPSLAEESDASSGQSDTARAHGAFRRTLLAALGKTGSGSSGGSGSDDSEAFPRSGEPGTDGASSYATGTSAGSGGSSVVSDDSRVSHGAYARHARARRHRRRKSSGAPPSMAAAFTGLESDMTVLERGAGDHWNPASGLALKRMKHNVAQIRKHLTEVRARQRMRGDDSVLSSHGSSVRELDAAEEALAREQKAQYLAYLQNEHRRGNCPAPDPAASEGELRNMLEMVVYERERRMGIDRARMLLVLGFYAFELVLRFLRAPLRAEGLGLYMQRALESGRLDTPLDRLYRTRLHSLVWDSRYDIVLAIFPVLVSFLMAKYAPQGDSTPVLPGVPLPPRQTEASDMPTGFKGTLDMFGGLSNIGSMAGNLLGMFGGNAAPPPPPPAPRPPVAYPAAPAGFQAAPPPVGMMPQTPAAVPHRPSPATAVGVHSLRQARDAVAASSGARPSSAPPSAAALRGSAAAASLAALGQRGTHAQGGLAPPPLSSDEE